MARFLFYIFIISLLLNAIQSNPLNENNNAQSKDLSSLGDNDKDEIMETAEHTIVFRPLFAYRQQKRKEMLRRKLRNKYKDKKTTRPYYFDYRYYPYYPYFYPYFN